MRRFAFSLLLRVSGFISNLRTRLAVDRRPVPARARAPKRKKKSPPAPALIRKSNSTSPAVLPHTSAHVSLCRNDLLLLTLIGWIKINSLHEQRGFINHAATRARATADVAHPFRRSAIDHGNAHESSWQVKWYLLCKKPTNRRVAARRCTLDLFLCFLRALRQRSMSSALIPGPARRVSAGVWGAFSVDCGH